MAAWPIDVYINNVKLDQGYTWFDSRSTYTVTSTGLTVDNVSWTYEGDKIFLGFNCKDYNGSGDHGQFLIGATGELGDIKGAEGNLNFIPIEEEPTSISILTIEYKGNEIFSTSTPGTKIIKTAGKWMEDDLGVIVNSTGSQDLFDGSITSSIISETPTIINFTVQLYSSTKTYQAEDGMVWREWIISAYNTDGFTEYSDGSPTSLIYGSDGYQVVPDNSNYVSGYDCIIAGHTYHIITGGPT